MARVIISLLFGAVTFAITHWSGGRRLWSVVLGVLVAVATVVVTSVKSIVEIVKATLETAKTAYELQIKKKELTDAKASIKVATAEEIGRFGIPYRIADNHVLKAVAEAQKELAKKQFITASSESRIQEKSDPR
jgi:hypothetical protein